MKYRYLNNLLKKSHKVFVLGYFLLNIPTAFAHKTELYFGEVNFATFIQHLCLGIHKARGKLSMTALEPGFLKEHVLVSNNIYLCGRTQDIQTVKTHNCITASAT